MTPGTVVNVVNSYAATSEYTPARLLSNVDLPTDGKPGEEYRKPLVTFTLLHLSGLSLFPKYHFKT